MSLCAECGEPSLIGKNGKAKKFCSKKCANKFWFKTEAYLKNKCLQCGNNCRHLYCSVDCQSKFTKKTFTAICLKCDKEFTYHKESYKKRGQMIYCSNTCKNSVYSVNETFFTHHSNIEEIYQVLGYLFATGRIQDYGTHDIDIKGTKSKLEMLSNIVGSNFPIFSSNSTDSKGNDNFRIKIRNRVWMNYLDDIGFKNDLMHSFPIILPEYVPYFIAGYIDSPLTSIKQDSDNRVITIKAKSYSLIQGIADFTGGEVITSKLEYHCIIKDNGNPLYNKLS